jgi:hypothetical protein
VPRRLSPRRRYPKQVGGTACQHDFLFSLRQHWGRMSALPHPLPRNRPDHEAGLQRKGGIVVAFRTIIVWPFLAVKAIHRAGGGLAGR